MSGKTYDVVVLGFRPRAAEDPALAIARVIDVTVEEGESLIRNAPRAVRSNVDYASAEACAASLGLAGAEVTIAVHPFDGPLRPDSDRPQVVEVLTTRSTEPGAAPGYVEVVEALPVEPAPEREPQPASWTRSDATPEAAQDVEGSRGSLPERDSRIMSVLSRHPRGPRNLLRYAGMAVATALFYLVWLYLLERW